MTGIPEGGADQILHWDTTKLGPQPSQADLDAAEAAAKAAATSAANKAEAARLLQQTDWVEIPSVTDPASSPHLLNKDEFMVYRAALRAIAVNAPSAPVEFPQAPAETWSS
jgi:hypothetical protein